MDRERAREAARLLRDCWQGGTVIESLPEGLRPADRAGGYAIQAAFAALGGGPAFGWKIAATSAAGQAHIGVDGPLAGRLLADRVYGDGATLSLAHNRMAVAEPEFAFRLGADLPPRAEPWTPKEAVAAAAALHAAIEVPDSRFAPFERAGGPQLIADNACARDFVLGPAMPDSWRETDLAAHPVEARVAGGPVHEGAGRNVLGGPRIALAWIANELSRLGVGLRAGEIVTTGTCAQPLPIAPGARVEMDFGPLGRVTASFGE